MDVLSAEGQIALAQNLENRVQWVRPQSGTRGLSSWILIFLPFVLKRTETQKQDGAEF